MAAAAAPARRLLMPQQLPVVATKPRLLLPENPPTLPPPQRLLAHTAKSFFTVGGKGRGVSQLE